MAITINVNGIQSGGGGNQQPPTPPQQPPTPPTPPTPPPTPPTPPGGGGSGGGNQPQQPYRYQRPDFSQYGPSAGNGGGVVNRPLPTSDMLVQDIRREMSTRGVFLVPGTNNFSTMMNTLRQSQRSSVMGAIDNDYNARMFSIDARKDALMYEVSDRIEKARQSELSSTNDPIRINDINKRYDSLLNRETSRVDKFFASQYDSATQDRDNQQIEAENRLTEAMQRLTDELSQGNKDSYLNQLRDKYKEQVWRRDNADTEEEAREASREAAKIQERMQRAMNPGASPTMQRWLGAAGTIATTAIHTGIRLDELGIQEDYLGFGMASSILNGNATAAIRQRNAIERQENSTLATGIGAGAGAIAGAAIGSYFAGVGAIPGYILGGLIGTLVGTGGGALVSHAMNRDLMIEDERTRVADLWRQEEQRMMQFNNLVMMTRGTNTDIGGVRNWYMKSIEGWDGRESGSASERLRDPFRPSTYSLDIYDLGYTAPEFAEKAYQRIKQRGIVRADSIENALEADALERVYSLNSGALGQLSAFDRLISGYNRSGAVRANNANQDFTNLAFTLANLNTTGMSEGQWARSDEFLGYMTQLGQAQRSTFLTVDNARSGRQIATGQAIFGDKFGPEAMQGIQSINNQVQNPGGGFAKTLLYDIIQELYPDTRGDLRKIRMAQYDPSRQNRIQTEYAKRIAAIYGGPETTSGFLAFQEIYGIQNPNVLNPLAKQMVSGGGLESERLDTSHPASQQTSVLNNGYTPEITKEYNMLADKQMYKLLEYQGTITSVIQNILSTLENDIQEKLQEAVDNLK